MIPPPTIQRGLLTLDRALFKKSVSVMAIRIPANMTMECKKALGTDLLLEPKIRNVIESNDGEKSRRLVLLSLAIKNKDLEGASEKTKEFVKGKGIDVTKAEFNIEYDHWTADEILRAILPEEIIDEAPSSFTTVGHIAHMNLKDEYLPFKHLIGQVILDKNPNLRTVVNKTDSIDTTFRFFKMEVLAGEDNMIAEVKESGCRFKFDFAHVYWNSRLHTEHERLVKMFRATDAVCDVMAGVGPFAMPAAKKGCMVYANDLNPVSYKYMIENKTLNKIKDNLHIYNLDGREFVRKAVEDLEKSGYKRPPEAPVVAKGKKGGAKASVPKPEPTPASTAAVEPVVERSHAFQTFDHFVMNLPATAIEFLDAFRGLFHGREEQIPEPKTQLPMIHCHCFSKSDKPDEDVRERVEAVMGGQLDRDTVKLHWVRKVAPNKDMYCISFRLPAEIAFASDVKRKFESEPESSDTISGTSDTALAEKRAKTE
ncbi:tRNA(m(1)G37)methyltransferase [Mortierella polycephala]|uniref:tRNA (guanine(37)-N1)-methyltransferase n=1 Tax=Mortierella polycephala TaxID=41804 RepID=A0A9P6TWS2_9FUNG|nr:tRNA(m(1)G37)methyltransferase [Mortierella polycephala]